MLIGYDGRFITENPTGNGVYATRLIESLSAVDTEGKYRVYMAGPAPSAPARVGPNVEIRVLHPWHRRAWFRVPVSFPWELYRRPVDIFHAHYTVPARLKTKVVLTLHDFFVLLCPKTFVPWARLPIAFSLKKSIGRADRILVGTTFIQSETTRHFRVPRERVVVIPYGLDPQFLVRASREQVAAAQAKYGIDAPYILAVGDIHPRKNLGRLLEAFVRLPEHNDLKLVIVGKHLWKSTDLIHLVRRARLEDRVITTGYLPQQDLPLLYQGAELFCYPSLYEGFGFPILEAMASRVPVATSNTTSCPEVGGDAAVYFDPTNVEEIARALSRLLTDTELRAKSVRAGIEQAGRFTWEKAAKRTMDVYRALL